jgi:hypothetical protein
MPVRLEKNRASKIELKEIEVAHPAKVDIVMVVIQPTNIPASPPTRLTTTDSARN